jgi:hypothetical protein
MTRRHRHWRAKTMFGGAIGLLSCAAVVVLDQLAMLTSAVATPITYVLNPPVTGGGATVVGGFTFDATGPILDTVSLSVTGGPQPGSYIVPVSATSTEIAAEMPNATDMILLIFANPLGDTPDPLSAIAFPPTARDPAPATGEAVPSTLEPTSLALLAGALGAFLLLSRDSRRASPRRFGAPTD